MPRLTAKHNNSGRAQRERVSHRLVLLIRIAMLILIKSFGPLLIIASALCCRAQSVAPSPLPKPHRTIGRAEIFSLKNPDRVRGQVRLFVVGTPDDLAKQKDVLIFEVALENPGAKISRPQYIHFYFHSYSSKGHKYKDRHKLGMDVIYLDGSHSLGGDTRLVSSGTENGMTVETLVGPRFWYDDFVRMISAQRVDVGVGQTIFTLLRRELDALKDLTKIVDK